MHSQAFKEIQGWVSENQEIVQGSNVADLGALNINGAVKDIIPHAVGFDICSGKGVDVVLEPGKIPVDHLHKYDIVFCVNALNACPNTEIYYNEVSDLLQDHGLFFLIFRLGNVTNHSTSPNKYGYTWYVITDPSKIVDVFKRAFTIIKEKHIIESNDYCVIMKR